MSARRAPELPPSVAAVLGDQAGVISSAQILGLGHSRHAVETWRRNRLLTIRLPGVYADHTGEPTWLQRAWAAVLYAADGGDLHSAALCGGSAVRAHEGPGRLGDDQAEIEVAIAHGRRSARQPGIRVRRVGWLDDDHVVWTRSPPRQRYEAALLDVAVARLGRAGPRRHLDAVGVLARAVGGRRTTAARLAAALAGRPRATERAWLVDVLDDIAAGTCSVLEHGYRTRVAGPHALPPAELQARATAGAGVVYRDADYGERIVELDGEIGHTTTAERDSDHERDLDAALVGKATTRLSWGQVFDRPCVTAGKIARLLADAGWPGRPSACGPGCRAPEAFAGERAA